MSPHKGVMLLLLVIFGFLGCSNAEMFSLDVPGGSIQANLGSSVLLPCELSPALNVESFEVRWHRPNQFDNPVLLYKDLKIQESSVDPQYRGRVNLVGDLQKGDVSLKLKNLTVADRGEYVCYVKSNQWYERASVILNITVVGSPVLLSFAEAEDQLNVTCSSDGWSQKPTLTWKNKKGIQFRNTVVQHKTDSEGLVSVRSWLMFSPSDSEWISCSVGLSDQEIKEGRVLPVKPAPPVGVSPGWKASFITLLVFSMLVFTAMALFIIPKTKDYIITKIREITSAESNSSKEEMLCAKDEKTNLLEVCSPPTVQASAVKVSPETTDRDTQTPVPEKVDKETNTEKEIPDWEKMTGCKVAIRPDASTTSFLEVGEKKSRVTCKSDVRDKTRFNHVLCKERIISGLYYWEITGLTEPLSSSVIKIIKYKCPSSWYVGITSESSEKKVRVPLTPQNGYWVLHYEKERGYYVNNPLLIPILMRDRFSRLGVFIDCERHTLSFYDCDKKSHIYTFYNVNSTQPLIPVLSPGDKEKHTLTICLENCVNFGELYTQPEGKVSSANADVDSLISQFQNTSISQDEGEEVGPSHSPTESNASKSTRFQEQPMAIESPMTQPAPAD